MLASIILLGFIVWVFGVVFTIIYIDFTDPAYVWADEQPRLKPVSAKVALVLFWWLIAARVLFRLTRRAPGGTVSVFKSFVRLLRSI